MAAHPAYVTAENWDLEEIPYDTGDPSGGWYLHFDATGEATDDVLYMSKAHVTPERARLLAAASTLRAKLAAVVKYCPVTVQDEIRTLLDDIDPPTDHERARRMLQEGRY